MCEFVAPGEDGSRAFHDHVAQPAPVLVVVVDDEGDVRILRDVADAPQGTGRIALGLGVDGGIDDVVSEGKADGDDEGTAATVGRGQAPHAGLAQEGEGPRGSVGQRRHGLSG